MRDLLRAAAAHLVLEDFDPGQPFALSEWHGGWGRKIVGPSLYATDCEDEILSLFFASSAASLHVHKELKHFAALALRFEYEDPEFPDNLLKAVNSCLDHWVALREAYRDEGLLIDP